MESTFNERGVTITRNSLAAGSQMVSLRDIEDIRIATGHKRKKLPLAISIIGVAVAVAGAVYQSGAAVALGAMLVVVGFLAWSAQEVTHQLIVKTPNGDREAVTSPDLEFLARVEKALRDALPSPRST
jgi:Family of unknown function (DUF6232)